MTTQATPAFDIDERLSRLETTLALFMEEQREWRTQFVEDQREWRAQFVEDQREWRAQFMEEQREWRTQFMEEQREWRREFNASLNRLEARIDKLDANINRLYFATFSVVGALAVAVIVASIFS
ncbi:MAG: hypothetical protein J4G13_12400 [Dehalococcoidia bacterium]|nr:hypothetical protein [Dehalococcoidia bacterium]